MSSGAGSPRVTCAKRSTATSTLDELRELWRPINRWSYLDRVRHTRTLLVYARYDLTFPVDLSRVLVDEFARRELPHEVAVLPCGHYSTGIAPFSYHRMRTC